METSLFNKYCSDIYNIAFFSLKICKNVDFRAENLWFLSFLAFSRFSKNKILQKPTPPSFFQYFKLKFSEYVGNIISTLFCYYIFRVFWTHFFLEIIFPTYSGNYSSKY